ncbi:MAG: hypothetical protein K8R75_02975 [Deltaproteobacteria bacterium]|nr:hypothetical protein [Deltaproteobacteria bacterium]
MVNKQVEGGRLKTEGMNGNYSSLMSGRLQFGKRGYGDPGFLSERQLLCCCLKGLSASNGLLPLPAGMFDPLSGKGRAQNIGKRVFLEVRRRGLVRYKHSSYKR